MQILISWLLQKPTDLDLHCLQRLGISRFSRTRVKAQLKCYLLITTPMLHKFIWAAWQENIPCDVCSERRLKSACASVQSYQSSLSAWRNFVSDCPKYAQRRFCSDYGNMQADLNLCWASMLEGRFSDFVTSYILIKKKTILNILVFTAFFSIIAIYNCTKSIALGKKGNLENIFFISPWKHTFWVLIKRALLISIHNICFYRQIRKYQQFLVEKKHLIWFSRFHTSIFTKYRKVQEFCFFSIKVHFVHCNWHHSIVGFLHSIDGKLFIDLQSSWYDAKNKLRS